MDPISEGNDESAAEYRLAADVRRETAGSSATSLILNAVDCGRGDGRPPIARSGVDLASSGSLRTRSLISCVS